MNNHAAKKHSLFQNKYSVIIASLSLLFFIMLLSLIFAWKKESGEWRIDTETMYGSLEAGNYQRLYQLCCIRRAQTPETDEDILELYTVADYYYNALYYYGKQDSKSADLTVYRDNMARSASSTGDLSYAIDEIDALFDARANLRQTD